MCGDRPVVWCGVYIDQLKAEYEQLLSVREELYHQLDAARESEHVARADVRATEQANRKLFSVDEMCRLRDIHNTLAVTTHVVTITTRL